MQPQCVAHATSSQGFGFYKVHVDLIEVGPMTRTVVQRIWKGLLSCHFQQWQTSLKAPNAATMAKNWELEASWVADWVSKSSYLYSYKIVDSISPQLRSNQTTNTFRHPVSLSKISPRNHAARTSSTNWKNSPKVTHQKSAGTFRWSSIAP